VTAERADNRTSERTDRMDWLTDATELADSKMGKLPAAKRTSDWPLSDPRVNAAQAPAKSSRLSVTSCKKRVSDWIGNWQVDDSQPEKLP